MTVLLPVAAALAAILILPGLSFYFDVAPKVAAIVVAAALTFLLPHDRPAEMRAPGAKPLRWFRIILLAQAALIALATIFSTHPLLSLLGGTWRRSGAMAEIALLALAAAGAEHLAGNRERVRLLLRITVLTSIPISIYGVLQYFGIDPLLTSAGYHFGEGQYTIVRPPGTLGHAAYFATYLLYVAFAGAGLARQEEKRSWQLAAMAAALLALFAMVLSGTRAALLGVAVGAIFVLLRERPGRTAMALVAAFAIATGVFYFSPAGEKLRARAFWSSEDRLGGARLLLWRDALRMAGGRWVTGYGPETFALEFPKHESRELARAYPDFYHESPHNIFLDALDSEGIGGLAAMLALAALCLLRARGPMGGAFVAMLVSQQFTAFTLPTELYFYLAAAMIVSEGAPAAVEKVSGWPWRWSLAIPLAGFAIFLSTGDALLGAARRAMDKGEVERALQLEDDARRWHMTADVYFSRRWLGLSQALAKTDSRAALRAWQAALVTASRGAETAEDRQNALLNLASMQAALNDPAGVERSLRLAVEAAPEYYKSHWLLAQVLELEKRMPQARVEAQAAMDLGGGKHDEVVATYQRLSR